MATSSKVGQSLDSDRRFVSVLPQSLVDAVNARGLCLSVWVTFGRLVVLLMVSVASAFLALRSAFPQRVTFPARFSPCLFTSPRLKQPISALPKLLSFVFGGDSITLPMPSDGTVVMIDRLNGPFFVFFLVHVSEVMKVCVLSQSQVKDGANLLGELGPMSIF